MGELKLRYGFENLLLNVLFIILPLYIYQIFLNYHIDHRKYSKLVMAILLAISILLCLSFPVPFFDGFTFDLRQIPLIIGALYGGFIVAIPLALLLVLYRFLIGDDGFYVNFYVISLIFIFVPLLRNHYLLLKPKFKIISNMIASILFSILIVVSANKMADFTTLDMDILSLEFVFIQCITIALITYLIEKMRESMILQNKIQETERLHIISQLAASVSHEVRNPLTVTKGFLQLLQDNDIPDQKKSEYLRLALSELKRAEDIITDYLSFAKPKLNNECYGNLIEDVKESISILLPYAVMNQVQITSNLDTTSDVKVKYDCQRFRQCLINIGKNAIEAMTNGGLLTFHLKCENQNSVTIDIIDTGIGMSPVELSKVGTPYYSTKEKGTGLGMLVVNDMIRTMGGTIKIKSKKGEGTTFSITLPTY